MWSVKFDNFNKDKLGMQVTAYGYDDEGHVTNYDMNNSLFNIKNPEKNTDYINKLSEDFFKSPNFRFGYLYKNSYNELQKNEQFFNGRIRNLMFFKGHLTPNEERSLFKKGIVGNYTWNFQYDEEQVKNLINDTNSTFFLGMVGIYDCANVLVQNCLIKFNGKIYNLEN